MNGEPTTSRSRPMSTVSRGTGGRSAGLFITRSIDALNKETEEAEGPRLRRVLGPWALIAIGLGNMVGAGIFATIGTGIHDLAGPAVIVSFIIAAIVSALAALCYAEIS